MLSESAVIGRVASVNVGQPRTVEWYGRRVRTSIWKAPVEGPVVVKGVNLAGDEQSDLRVHGGYDKAIYAYALEDYQWWSSELGVSLKPGTFGENLTTEGIELADAIIGEQWLVGSATLEVSEPRLPCYKLGMRMGDATFVDDFDRASRFGTYLRIVDEGEVTAGNEIVRVQRPDSTLTIGDLVETHHRPTPGMLARVAATSAVPERWRVMAERALLRRQAR
jgi:MOSC domain-containing protein YiiM